MSDHIRRGARVERDVDTDAEPGRDGAILHRHYCRECNTQIKLRARQGEYAYVRLGCECGAVELALRIADIIEGDTERDGIEEWETRRPKTQPPEASQ